MTDDDARRDESDDRDASAEDGRADQGLTLVELIRSVLAAAFGVQSSRNRERDFSRGKPSQFIIIGGLFTVVLVFAVAGIVSLVLRSLT